MDNENLNPIYIRFRQAASALMQEHKAHPYIRNFVNALNLCLTGLNSCLNVPSEEGYRVLEKNAKGASKIDGELAQALLTSLPPEVLKNRLFAFPLAARLYQSTTQAYAQDDLPDCLTKLGGGGYREEAALVGYIKAGHVKPIHVLHQSKPKDLVDHPHLAQLLERAEPKGWHSKMSAYHLHQFVRNKSPDEAVRLVEYIKTDEDGDFTKLCAETIPADAYLKHRQGKNLRDVLLNSLSEQLCDKFMAKLANHYIIKFAAYGDLQDINSATTLCRNIKATKERQEFCQRINIALSPRHRPARANRFPANPLWRKPEL